ncbi:MAG TPA: hypothetical protein VF017_05445 [Thermoanaerobaculia bacterium]|nr:hypothetical protein [Thermoanaerobaculia bacterium]
MHRNPTHDDARLILELFEARREPRLREARDWFVRSLAVESLDDLDRVCPRGSTENASFRMVIGYWDMVASFVANEVLHRELFFESGQEMLLVWEKVKKIVVPMRERSGNPMALRNLERVSKAYLEWLDAHAPDFYPRWSAAIAALASPKG